MKPFTKHNDHRQALVQKWRNEDINILHGLDANRQSQLAVIVNNQYAVLAKIPADSADAHWPKMSAALAWRLFTTTPLFNMLSVQSLFALTDEVYRRATGGGEYVPASVTAVEHQMATRYVQGGDAADSLDKRCESIEKVAKQLSDELLALALSEIRATAKRQDPGISLSEMCHALRAETNAPPAWVVASETVAEYLSMFYEFSPAPPPVGEPTIYFKGTVVAPFGTLPLYVDRATPGEELTLGTNGNGQYEGGYVFAPFDLAVSPDGKIVMRYTTHMWDGAHGYYRTEVDMEKVDSLLAG